MHHKLDSCCFYILLCCTVLSRVLATVRPPPRSSRRAGPELGAALPVGRSVKQFSLPDPSFSDPGSQHSSGGQTGLTNLPVNYLHRDSHKTSENRFQISPNEKYAATCQTYVRCSELTNKTNFHLTTGRQ